MKELKDYLYHEEPAGVIYCGDCLEILPLLPDKSVDLVLTDPPYGLDYCSNHVSPWGTPRPAILNDGAENYQSLIESIANSFEHVVNDNSYIFIFGANKTCDTLKMVFDMHYNFKNIIIWDKQNWSCGDLTGNLGMQYEMLFMYAKGNPKINGYRWSNLWSIPRVAPEVTGHPTTKPEALCTRAISLGGGQIILDPFLGSGTTAVAAKQLGRKFIGIEIEPKYCQIAVERLRQEILL